MSLPNPSQESTDTTSPAAPTPANAPLHVIFVCWGNICRSPIAERVAEKMAADAGVTWVRFSSAATSSEEVGNTIDRRAARQLSDHGYRADGHRARQITADQIVQADLVIAMERVHIDRLERLVPGAGNLALLTDFDPTAPPGAGVDDPWYGPDSGFADTLAEIEQAIPGVLDWARENRPA